MQAFSPIVVATDFSDSAERAMQRGAQIAKQLEAELHLIHVVQPLDLYPGVDPAADFRQNHEQALHAAVKNRLDTLADNLRKDCAIQVVVATRIGRAHKEIADYAAAKEAYLVVTGARGEHTLLDLLIGSTASRLLRLATCPVLIVKNTETKPYQTAIAAVDFSPGSITALELARAVAPSAQIEVLHVYDTDHDDRMRQAGMDETFILNRQAHVIKDAEKHLDIELEKLNEGKISRNVVAAYPAAAICERAEVLRSDLIVLGRHGKSGMQELLLGSVSKDVANAADCDVLLCF
ncbi:MAG: universal stress protein [Gammaproteobacteria bacterium]|nr:universal stress protein [Gammaproteobacteria bacterium]MBU1732454.1 universal stress protein [Gammaproteobacteria bacterium]MBU1894024.1 universal stress protein [Gammaproteobacteria bacterium]